MFLSGKIISFYQNVDINVALPEGIEVMNPYAGTRHFETVKAFYKRYYNDNNSRILLMGINPGRWGAGVTGIPFTDPIALENYCKIPNTYPARKETSSVFIYKMIRQFGSVESFYHKFFIGSVSPLGFISQGRNLNYYDNIELKEVLYDYMKKQFVIQASLCDRKDICISIGEGKNFTFLKKLNSELKLFKEVKALPHPRFIMQYRFKRKNDFIAQYIELLSAL